MEYSKVLLLLLVVVVFIDFAHAGFAPGIVRSPTPSMGWRSWNQFTCDITQSIMENQIDALVTKHPLPPNIHLPANSAATMASLLDLGYDHIGLDDCWQLCSADGPAIDGGLVLRFPNGTIQVNTKAFPNMAAMVEYGHKRNVKMGFYLNNCRCHVLSGPVYYSQDVELAISLGFDGIKIDSCSQQRNLSEWAHQIALSGKELLMEDCNDAPPDNRIYPFTPEIWKAWEAELRDSCPYSFFRVSTDNGPDFMSGIWNANQLVRFLGEDPISRPGCWAYADMLEIGAYVPGAGLSTTESRTQFAIWATTSSPLILGFDLANETVFSEMWPIVANTELLKVSQSYFGHPGRLVLNSTEYFDTRWSHGAGPVHWEPCRMPHYQIWAKRQAGGTMAVVVANLFDRQLDISFPFSALNFDKSVSQVSVRDMWAHTNNGTLKVPDGVFSVKGLASRDNVAILLSP